MKKYSVLREHCYSQEQKLLWNIQALLIDINDKINKNEIEPIIENKNEIEPIIENKEKIPKTVEFKPKKKK